MPILSFEGGQKRTVAKTFCNRASSSRQAKREQNLSRFVRYLPMSALRYVCLCALDALYAKFLGLLLTRAVGLSDKYLSLQFLLWLGRKDIWRLSTFRFSDALHSGGHRVWHWNWIRPLRFQKWFCQVLSMKPLAIEGRQPLPQLVAQVMLQHLTVELILQRIPSNYMAAVVGRKQNRRVGDKIPRMSHDVIRCHTMSLRPYSNDLQVTADDA
jgi:hypothetical protein